LRDKLEKTKGEISSLSASKADLEQRNVELQSLLSAANKQLAKELEVCVSRLLFPIFKYTRQKRQMNKLCLSD
jgi:hypothetical protein